MLAKATAMDPEDPTPPFTMASVLAKQACTCARNHGADPQRSCRRLSFAPVFLAARQGDKDLAALCFREASQRALGQRADQVTHTTNLLPDSGPPCYRPRGPLVGIF